MGQLAYWLLNTDRMEARLFSVLCVMVKKEGTRLKVLFDGINQLIVCSNDMAKKAMEKDLENYMQLSGFNFQDSFIEYPSSSFIL